MQNLRAVVRISVMTFLVYNRLRLNNIDATVVVYNTKVSHTAEILRVLVIDLVDKIVCLSVTHKTLIARCRVMFAGVFSYVFTIEDYIASITFFYWWFW